MSNERRIINDAHEPSRRTNIGRSAPEAPAKFTCHYIPEFLLSFGVVLSSAIDLLIVESKINEFMQFRCRVYHEGK